MWPFVMPEIRGSFEVKSMSLILLRIKAIGILGIKTVIYWSNKFTALDILFVEPSIFCLFYLPF